MSEDPHRAGGGRDHAYLYGGEDMVAEVDTNGNRVRTYTYSPRTL